MVGCPRSRSVRAHTQSDREDRRARIPRSNCGSAARPTACPVQPRGLPSGQPALIADLKNSVQLRTAGSVDPTTSASTCRRPNTRTGGPRPPPPTGRLPRAASSRVLIHASFSARSQSSSARTRCAVSNASVGRRPNADQVRCTAMFWTYVEIRISFCPRRRASRIMPPPDRGIGHDREPEPSDRRAGRRVDERSNR